MILHCSLTSISFLTNVAERILTIAVFEDLESYQLITNKYLEVQNYINSVMIEFSMISHVALFYKDYFMYSDLPQEEVEILHTYLIGSSRANSDKYLSNWMDHGASGKITKIKAVHNNESDEDNAIELLSSEFPDDTILCS